MKLRRISLPVSELEKLPSAERDILFLFGHINNEISSLVKVHEWSVVTTTTPGFTEIERNASNAQSLIYARILAGKLEEAWGAINRSWFAHKAVSADLAKFLHPDAVAALAALKVYFKGGNLIHKVRNDYAFHYNTKSMGQSWERASQEQFFEIIIGVNRGSTINLAAELVANVAVFHSVTPDNVLAGMGQFLSDVRTVSVHFQGFFEGVTRAIIERASGRNLDELGTLVDIFPNRKYSDVAIPVFCLPDDPKKNVDRP
ncbi:MAG: hypothetical protein Q7T69_02615 [Rhodoferax sp.]|nr:hypothetical protein [Rhodoferax sp.]